MIGRKLRAKKVNEGIEMPRYAHVCAALINQSYETVTLEAGTRVCQLVVMPYVPCELVPVDELSDTERGAGGFGSTGVE